MGRRVEVLTGSDGGDDSPDARPVGPPPVISRRLGTHTQNASRILRKVKRVALATVIVRTIGVVRQNKKNKERATEVQHSLCVCFAHNVCPTLERMAE